MASTRDEAIQLLNDATLCADAAEKVLEVLRVPAYRLTLTSQLHDAG